MLWRRPYPKRELLGNSLTDGATAYRTIASVPKKLPTVSWGVPIPKRSALIWPFWNWYSTPAGPVTVLPVPPRIVAVRTGSWSKGAGGVA